MAETLKQRWERILRDAHAAMQAGQVEEGAENASVVASEFAEWQRSGRVEGVEGDERNG
jgi:hypothetical protein